MEKYNKILVAAGGVIAGYILLSGIYNTYTKLAYKPKENPLFRKEIEKKKKLLSKTC